MGPVSERITTVGSSDLVGRDAAASRVADLVHEVVPSRRLDSLHLEDSVALAAKEVIEEHRRSDLLRGYNLEPRNRILLDGPPGNGKTSLAEAIAAETMLPFYVVRYEGIVSSFLGETASRLDQAFEFVRTRRCVLFFDEFDTVARNRADTADQETRTTVNQLLQSLEEWRGVRELVVMAATNDLSNLDPAVTRSRAYGFFV